MPTFSHFKNSAVSIATLTVTLGLAFGMTPEATGQTLAGVFIDGLAGDDQNPGTQERPWKTFAKLPWVRLKAGEAINIRCGSIYRENLKLGPIQLSAGSMVLGYGTECSTQKAVISAADNLSGGWQKEGVVWSRPLPPGTPKIQRLFIDGVPLRVAQWPNFGGIGKEYAISAATSPIGKTALQVGSKDLPLLANKDLAGAMLQVRSEHWQTELRPISAFDSTQGVLQLTTPTQYSMEPGNGYVLQDKRWMLDAPGEFFHDVAAGVLYAIPSEAKAQQNINGSLVEGTVRNRAVDLYGRPNLFVSNVAGVMAAGDGIILTDAPGSVLDNVIGSYNRVSGVRLVLNAATTDSPARTVVRNSRFVGNWHTGINTEAAPNADILNNEIVDTGVTAHAGWSPAGVLLGVANLFEGNLVRTSAYHGVRYTGQGGTIIRKNQIEAYCLRFSDCGGIYTWNGPRIDSVPDQRSTVTSNIVYAANPNMEGSMPAGPQNVAAIYIDDMTRSVTVSKNTVIGTPYGIYLHNTSNSTVSENRLWLNTLAGLWARMDYALADAMTNNTFQLNQIVPRVTAAGSFPSLPTYSSGVAFKFQHTSGTVAITGGSNLFIQNRVFQQVGGGLPVATVGTGIVDAAYSEKDWIALNSQESRVVRKPEYRLVGYTDLRDELNPTDNFRAGLRGWRWWSAVAAAPAAVRLTQGAVGCAAVCAEFVAGSSSDLFYSPGFPLVSGSMYRYAYEASFSAPTALPRPYLTQDSTPWNLMIAGGVSSSSPSGGLGGDVIQFEGLFKASSTAQARVNLQVSPGTPVAFGSISVREVRGYVLGGMQNWIGIQGAPRGQSAKVTCSSLGWTEGCSATDLLGQIVQLPQVIPAGDVRIYLRSDSTWRGSTQ